MEQYIMAFLTDIMPDSKTVFPTGAPRSLMLDVQNNNQFPCGQISAVSLANGGSVRAIC